MNKTVFLPHGGGPMPLLDPDSHQNMNDFIKNISFDFNPDAIVIFSAHHETDGIHVIYDNVEGLVFDYYGFPKETYQYSYNPPKDLELGEQIIEKLSSAGFDVYSSDRGFDHGVFVPLLLMYPHAEIPVIQISLHKSLDPSLHIKLGETLSTLDSKNILFIGSGYSFHNMREFFNQSTDEKNNQFHNWLVETLSSDITEEEREDKLINWKDAPYGTYAHPRSEHLIPLHICYGLNKTRGKITFDDIVYTKRTIGVEW